MINSFDLLSGFKIIIRDDDLCARSDLAMHKEVLEFYSSINCPFIIGLVPNSCAFKEGLGWRTYDYGENMSLAQSDKLLTYISELARFDHRIFMHGYSHAYTSGRAEFANLSNSEASSLIRMSFDIFNASGINYVDGFIPPSNTLSIPSIQAIIERFKFLSYRITRKQILSSHNLLFSSLLKKIRKRDASHTSYLTLNKCHLLPYVSISLKDNNDEEIVRHIIDCKKFNSPCTIATHYWEAANPALQKRLQALSQFD
jgi:hypothetical protein